MHLLPREVTVFNPPVLAYAPTSTHCTPKHYTCVAFKHHIEDVYTLSTFPGLTYSPVLQQKLTREYVTRTFYMTPYALRDFT